MANLSLGGNRAFSFQDIIGILNEDISNATSPDLTLDLAYTIFAGITETATMRDSTLGGSVTATANTIPTWGSGSYGLMQWAA